jgi:sulfur carrier protein
MKTIVNGDARDVRDGLTLGALLLELGISRAGVAVAVNETVLRGASVDGHRLQEGDAVEIIRAVAGG